MSAAKRRAYIIKFAGAQWTRTAPDGALTSHLTLQEAVESARWLAAKDGADVVWYDRAGGLQGRSEGWQR